MSFNLTIHCVDNETVYALGSPHPKYVLAFLEMFDHEGSSLSLDCPDGTTWRTNRDVYEQLESRINE